MIENLPFEKRISLLQRQIDELNTLEYNDDRHEKISVFKHKTKRILKKLISDPDEYISELQKITFRPFIHIPNEPTDHQLEKDFLLSGIRQTKRLLQNAISDIELEKEISYDEEAIELNFTPQKILEKNKTKVFIVHGHDDGLKNEVALFIQRLGLEAIILHEQVSRSQTIIEKIESYSDVGFSIVLYTPCDIGGSVSSEKVQPRARQNVVFEHGYFVAKLGRENVVALKKGQVEVPNDLSGMVYVSYEQNNWKRDIAHELKASGYKIDFEKV